MLSNSKRDLYQTRRPAHEVTAAYEDAGLFKTAICQQMLELIPQMRRNDRGDLIVRAFVDRKIEIDVFFAGRRAAETGPLENQLKALMSHARKQAADTGAKLPDVTLIRLPTRVEGAWRRSLQRDDSGWETGTYHFVVARWSLLDKDGKTVSFGEAPAASATDGLG
ncbi:MAG: hypothetical protein V2I76_12295 [Roseobacter sp.]|jgi:hypothetical protein|nr:hypothetical protein [Roseobacter sp.]